jgi:tetratricopeptide (TPR) repeat protein
VSSSKDPFPWEFGTYTREEPDYAMLRYNKGVEKLQANKIEIAGKYFEESIRFNPLFIDALFNLGVVYKRMDRIDDACSMWLKASRLGDAEAGSLYNQNCTDKN